MRRLRQITTTDFAETRNGWQLQMVAGTFGLFGLLFGYAGDSPGETLFFLLAFLAPLVALVFTQHTIVGRRTRGELSVLLSLPFSRRDIVCGVWLSRTLFMVSVLVAAYFGGVIGTLVGGGSLDQTMLVGGFVFTLIISAIFVSIGIGISAATRSTTVASVGIFGTYLLFVFQLWQAVPEAILYLIRGFDSPESLPTWAEVFAELSPFSALSNALAPVFDALADDLPLASGIPADPPLYMEPWVGAPVVFVWILLPVAVGYWQFNRTDL